MNVKELMRELATFSPDAEVVLYDRGSEEEYRMDPDNDQWDFAIMRGENQLVVEFG